MDLGSEENFNLDNVSPITDSDSDEPLAAAGSPNQSGMAVDNPPTQTFPYAAFAERQPPESGRYSALDVHTFFLLDPQNSARKVCSFCKYVHQDMAVR